MDENARIWLICAYLLLYFSGFKKHMIPCKYFAARLSSLILVYITIYCTD